MKQIKVTLENGDFFCTSINGTEEEIRSYYIGTYFNLGVETDNLVKAIRVEFL